MNRWVATTTLGAGAVMAAAAMSLATTPAAHAGPTDDAGTAPVTSNDLSAGLVTLYNTVGPQVEENYQYAVDNENVIVPADGAETEPLGGEALTLASLFDATKLLPTDITSPDDTSASLLNPLSDWTNALVEFGKLQSDIAANLANDDAAELVGLNSAMLTNSGNQLFDGWLEDFALQAAGQDTTALTAQLNNATSEYFSVVPSDIHAILTDFSTGIQDGVSFLNLVEGAISDIGLLGGFIAQL